MKLSGLMRALLVAEPQLGKDLLEGKTAVGNRHRCCTGHFLMKLHHFEMKGLNDSTREFYRTSMRILQREGIPFLVGGAYAFACYTGIVRHTKDLDLFTTPELAQRALEAFQRAGYRTEVTSETWIYKAFQGDDFVDLIFRSGNAVSEVDGSWFEAAEETELLGVPVKLCPPEEILWMKAFLMERERFDGADVAHLLLCRASAFDWPRLIQRFGPYRRVLLAHLLLFGFIYPDQTDAIPSEVMDRLWEASRGEPLGPRVCRGTLLSRAGYLLDVKRWGWRDIRFSGGTRLSIAAAERWREALAGEHERDLKFSQIALEDSADAPNIVGMRRSA